MLLASFLKTTVGDDDDFGDGDSDGVGSSTGYIAITHARDRMSEKMLIIDFDTSIHI